MKQKMFFSNATAEFSKILIFIFWYWIENLLEALPGN